MIQNNLLNTDRLHRYIYIYIFNNVANNMWTIINFIGLIFLVGKSFYLCISKVSVIDTQPALVCTCQCPQIEVMANGLF